MVLPAVMSIVRAFPVAQACGSPAVISWRPAARHDLVGCRSPADHGRRASTISTSNGACDREPPRRPGPDTRGSENITDAVPPAGTATSRFDRAGLVGGRDLVTGRGQLLHR